MRRNPKPLIFMGRKRPAKPFRRVRFPSSPPENQGLSSFELGLKAVHTSLYGRCTTLKTACWPFCRFGGVEPCVLDLLGLCIDLAPTVVPTSALKLVARSISTSYRDVLSASELQEMLRSGHAPQRFHPHLMVVLDETPLPLVVRIVTESATASIPAKRIMQHLGAWAAEWQTTRQVWS